MIKLIEAQVWKYKSIEDSTPVAISDAVTVLVGKNESGKTTFLEALHKALPLTDAKFNYVADYPRKDLVRYRPDHIAGRFQEAVRLTFRIGAEVAEDINKWVFDGVEIVTTDTLCTQTTSYGNESTSGFSIDQKQALEALKKPLEGLEYMDDVFSEAETLEDVLARIEAKKLAPDSRLAVFAKTWRNRAPNAGSGWGFIEGYVWRNYLEPSTPKFLYFDDYKLLEGKINLPSLEQRKAAKQLNDADETAFGLLDLAGIH